MHVICLLSMKGGAGKSTVVQSLAVCAYQHEQRTLIVELDPQGSLKNWSKRREAMEPPVHQTLPQSLPEVIEQARHTGVNWLFIDTPGQQTPAALAAAEAADLILIPCKIQSMKDFDAAMLTIADARRVGKPAYVLMTQVPPNATRLVRQRQLQIQERYNVAVLSRYLSRRADFEYCDEHGLSAAEYNPRGMAAEETERLYGLIQSIFIAERLKARKPERARPVFVSLQDADDEAAENAGEDAMEDAMEDALLEPEPRLSRFGEEEAMNDDGYADHDDFDRFLGYAEGDS